MDLKIAKFVFQNTKGNKWHLEYNHDHWLLYINNAQVLTTARGEKKEYKTVETALKDIKEITGQEVKTLTSQYVEYQKSLLQ